MVRLWHAGFSEGGCITDQVDPEILLVIRATVNAEFICVTACG